MTEFSVDLNNCDREPIHIPGKIQSHGFLIAVDNKSFDINYISENVSGFTMDTAADFLGANIEALGRKLRISVPGSRFDFVQLLSLYASNKVMETINPFYLELGGRPFYLIINLSGDHILLEFEPAVTDLDVDIQKTIGRSVSQMLVGKHLDSLFENTAVEVKKMIGYDRVMIYKFNEDGHGEVIAEKKNENLDPFLGLHYPASDIPKQARELYKITLTRIIADVFNENAGMIADNNAPLDLTHAVLRAVSPIHIQYLKNMGVVSSFSISLLSHGELWGLIVCHNYSPRFINYKTRDACKLIGQILSSAIEFRQGEQDADVFIALNENVNTLIKNIEKENQVVAGLNGNTLTIRDITTASGAALFFNNAVTLIGLTPPEELVTEIIGWLKINMTGNLYHTHTLPIDFPPAIPYSNVASGLLATLISPEPGDMILWFKTEQIENKKWAGNPDKPFDGEGSGAMQISPRKSFESWAQLVKHSSEKWGRAEIAAVVNAREQILYTVNRKANELKILNEQLKQAYEQHDNFSFTVSHDLRTPLSSIKNYSEILLRGNPGLDANAKMIMERIQVCADKMELLIKEVSHYSKIGIADIEARQINMTALIHETQADLQSSLQPANLEFTTGFLPNIIGDRGMIKQVFSNLLQNAIKYSSKSAPAIVRVEGKLNKDEIIYAISDNGIGIDINYYDRVFELFRRMDNAKDFEGTGVGLAIVKRIMEKHHGKIWFESVLGSGTVFYLSFKN